MYIPKLLPKRWNLVSSWFRRVIVDDYLFLFQHSSINYLVVRRTPKNELEKKRNNIWYVVVVIKSRRHKVRSSLNARQKNKEIIPKNVQFREKKIKQGTRNPHGGGGMSAHARFTPAMVKWSAITFSFPPERREMEKLFFSFHV